MKDIPLNLKDPDGFYELLLKAHEGLTEEESERLNIGLIFTLANRIGDHDEISALFEATSAAIRA